MRGWGNSCRSATSARGPTHRCRLPTSYGDCAKRKRGRRPRRPRLLFQSGSSSAWGGTNQSILRNRRLPRTDGCGAWTFEIVKRDKLHRFAVLPKRRIVQRTRARTGRNRCLACDFERHARFVAPCSDARPRQSVAPESTLEGSAPTQRRGGIPSREGSSGPKNPKEGCLTRLSGRAYGNYQRRA